MIWTPASLCSHLSSFRSPGPEPPTSHHCLKDKGPPLLLQRQPGPVCLEVLWHFHCPSSKGCKVVSLLALSLCAGVLVLAPSPPPPFEAPLPAYVGRPPAAEAALTPPSVEPAPAFPVHRVQLSLSPVAAASWPGEMKKTT